MPDTEQKFFAVYGALRSGTTLLRLMLDAHPDLRCPSETDFLFDYLHEDETGRLSLDQRALEHNRIYRGYLKAVATSPPPEPGVDDLIARIAPAGETAVLVLHRNLRKALTLYPGMRIVHLLRDPRDVARSSIGMGWAGDVYHGVGHWIETESDWAACRAELAADQVLTVHYEELVQNPQKELGRISEFAGVQYHPAMLEYDATSTYSKPDPALIFQWKRKLSDKDIGLVEGRIGALLADTGYEPSGVAPRVPGKLGRISLKVSNRRAVWRTRIKRYGLVDPLLAAFANRLNMPALGYGARRRMDEKVKAYLK